MPHLPDTLPTARTPDAAAAPALRWGVLGTGWIAERFIRSAQRHTRQQFTAIGSRNADRSAAFAAQFGVPGSHGSYEELVADPAVDVIYVATPHNAHLAGARLALEAGKHVLVEKPLAINVAQATELAQLAAVVSFALWVLPDATDVRAAGQPHPAGVNGQAAAVLRDPGGNQAVLHTTLFSNTPTTAGGGRHERHADPAGALLPAR